MRLVDTHCHLYLKEFDADRAAMIQRAIESGVERFYLPNIDSGSIPDMLSLESAFPRNCFAMMGLHPCSVKENWEEELSITGEWHRKRKFAAAGEIGLDFYWDLSFKKEQIKAFEQQIEWAIAFDLPIVVHSRESIDACIEITESYQSRGLRGVFHCFSGNLQQATRLIDMGFYLGIGGVITYKKSGLDGVIKQTGLDNIVLETDAPYLSPVPMRGKRNESSYLSFVVQRIAEVTSISPEEIAGITTRNAGKLFRF